MSKERMNEKGGNISCAYRGLLLCTFVCSRRLLLWNRRFSERNWKVNWKRSQFKFISSICRCCFCFCFLAGRLPHLHTPVDVTARYPHWRISNRFGIAPMVSTQQVKAIRMSAHSRSVCVCINSTRRFSRNTHIPIKCTCIHTLNCEMCNRSESETKTNNVLV